MKKINELNFKEMVSVSGGKSRDNDYVVIKSSHYIIMTAASYLNIPLLGAIIGVLAASYKYSGSMTAPTAVKAANIDTRIISLTDNFIYSSPL